jgi:hypothetical protein
LVVYLSAKGLSRSFSFTIKVRIKRPETGELLFGGFQIGEPGAEEIKKSPEG